MGQFWEQVWQELKLEQVIEHVNLDGEYPFLEFFKKNDVQKVCDAGCGFGKYSVICGKNGFRVSGFDISPSSVEFTKQMLNFYNVGFDEYMVCGMTDIGFAKNSFDAVIAFAVIDHLTMENAKIALKELKRITRNHGLIYLSFDGLSEEDIHTPHVDLEDGSMEYTEGRLKGMLFKYYQDDEIERLLAGNQKVYYQKREDGTREVILMVEKNVEVR